MRVIAMYLSQFHRVPENDEWWGDGFTDWLPTRNAKKLFEGHYQPHVPLNGNYYDLMDKKTMQWQAERMSQYGIDGMCIYHYWFKDGRKILEKPVEMLLEEKDIQMPFCLYWANDSWVRSWSKIRDANSWVISDQKPENSSEEQGILLEQDYGDEVVWRSHFDYLLPFFKDSRYIKVDGKPLFMIYKSQLIHELDKMLKLWNQWAIESGLEGIYVIGAYVNGSIENSSLDAQLYHEPARSNLVFHERNRNEGVCKIGYDDIWQYILSDYSVNKNTYYGGFVGYDDTPRRGVRGDVIVGATPEKFEKYIAQLMAKNEASGMDITFVNAWNEWGEGMHLEPDEKYGVRYLEAIYRAKQEYRKYIGEYKDRCIASVNTFGILQRRCDKYQKYMDTLDIWMELREQGGCLDRVLIEKGYFHVALYGYGIFGRHFIQELKDSEVKIDYLIDQQKGKIDVEFPIYLPTEELPKCDAIVVAAFFFLDEIRKVLPKDMIIISIEELIQKV